MTLGLLSPLMQAFLGVASAVSALTFIEPATACAQDTIPRKTHARSAIT